MASDDDSPSAPQTPQSIPLRDLTRSAHGPGTDVYDIRRSRRRSSSGSDQVIGSRRSILRIPQARRYERIDEGSPQATDREAFQSRRLHAQAPLPYGQYDESESPVEDLGGFAAATSSVGLSFDPSATGPSVPTPPAYSDGPGFASHGGSSYNSAMQSHFTEDFEADTTPLTNASKLRPLNTSNSILRGQRHDRQPQRQSVRWLDGESPSRSPNLAPTRLGDDLPNLENGLHHKLSSGSGVSRHGSTAKSRERSLSPSASLNPLTRAGSIMRMMSQRVVNLSNEPEIVEHSIRRKSSETRRSARPDAPLDIPLSDYDRPETGDEPASYTPAEKDPPVVLLRRLSRDIQPYENPLKGNSLGIFPPENKLRRILCEMLIHPATEPIILVLIVVQTVLLAVDSAPSYFTDPQTNEWGRSNIDYALFGLFVIYTIELLAKCIVSGFVYNPEEYSTYDRSKGFRRALVDKAHSLFALPKSPQRTGSVKRVDDAAFQPSIIRSFTGLQSTPDMPGHGAQQQRLRLARRAFLRHSFNRLDTIAVVSFWISFALTFTHFETSRHVYVFRMMSCLRILRLLGLTSGTSVILRSLKRAAPSLLNVAFLISFFWLLFAIVGVQSFKSSLRRSCVWVGPPEIGNYTQNIAPENFQPCGGYLNATTGDPWPWRHPDGSNGASSSKGYLCPQGSVCVSGSNPYNNTVSFDNVPQSLELVFVIMTSNTFTDLMYYLMNSDHLAAALFFAAGIVIMSFWMMNLLVAVITNSFQIIREETRASAFAPVEMEEPPMEELTSGRIPRLKKLYERVHWLWILVIVFGLVVQCLRSANMGTDRGQFINNSETVVTLVLLIEIILRFASDWRNFFSSKRNWFDLGLAIVTAVMQIPPIHSSGQIYAWLSIFQIARIYRVVLAFSITRDLIMVVFGNIVGILNLILFVFMLSFLAAILASQLFRGELPTEDITGAAIHVTFADTYNSFIGMYQILSSENWTAILYNITQFDVRWDTAWLGAIFFIMWYILANFIVLNMFIAVIQESFDVTEDEKRLQQVKAFLQQKDYTGSSHGNLALSSIFKFGRDSMKHRDPLNYGPATMEMLLKDAVVRDFMDEAEPLNRPRSELFSDEPGATVKAGTLSAIWAKITGKTTGNDPNPFYSRLKLPTMDLDAGTMAKEVLTATEHRKRAQREYLIRHPWYNVSLFIFGPSHPLRRLCQRVVGPGRGDQRIEGVDPYKPLWYSFSAFVYAAIVCMVLLACITTPLYQRTWYQQNPNGQPWFIWTDMGFAVIFTIEAMIKVIADGFFWTPNAYFRGSWGFIDGIVLTTLWINVITSVFREDGVSRAVGAFKALRALRLLNVSNSARDTFHSVIIVGGWKVVSAAFVSISLLIPFAIYGLNLFNGQMESCNDTSFAYNDLSNCVGEYQSTPFNWTVLAPRQVGNPYYSFDNFGSSLFILFQIVSQEGWTDVMWSAMRMTGKGKQPQNYASQGNALYFIAFNLLGAVFVLTLFVSVFMRNYTEQTGVAFLTAEQRSWLELRKLLRQIKPSARSINQTSRSWQLWCYKIAVKKHSMWQRFITIGLMFHLTLLLVEFYPTIQWWETLRNYLFLGLTIIFLVNIVIRIVGLSWARFRKSAWDLFSILAVSGGIITLLMVLAEPLNTTFNQLNKLFLVAIALLLIPRNNQLDQLFKTAAASLTTIGNLLATWFVLFLVYAIAFTQTFGLTRFGSNENVNLNFRDVPKALILLFRMSCGEGWNQIMMDFATIEPPFCVFTNNFFDSDCGSGAWARALFISWNIISMYIFVSLFVSLIFESFSYVYQHNKSGLSIISREEVRRFKHAWSTYDPDATGFISKEQFPRLLGELSGIFSMRIYDGENTVSSILQDCRASRRESLNNTRIVDGVDLDKLQERLKDIDVKEIRAKRARMNIFYEEVLVSADLDRGISFTSCLMILAHYNIISDSKSLRLEEFLRRRARLQRVEEAVRRNVVIGFFDTMYWSRKFRRFRSSRRDSRMASVPSFTVPEIYVEDPDDIGGGLSTVPRDFTESPTVLSPPPTEGSSSSFNARGITPINTNLRRRGSKDNSPTNSDNPLNASPSLSPHRLSDLDTAYHGAARSTSPTSLHSPTHSREVSSVSAQGIMDGLDNSAWGESIRRSFTLRRPTSTRAPPR